MLVAVPWSWTYWKRRLEFFCYAIMWHLKAIACWSARTVTGTIQSGWCRIDCFRHMTVLDLEALFRNCCFQIYLDVHCLNIVSQYGPSVIVHLFYYYYLTGRSANLAVILTVHNGLETGIYRYANSKLLRPVKWNKHHQQLKSLIKKRTCRSYSMFLRRGWVYFEEVQKVQSCTQNR